MFIVALVSFVLGVISGFGLSTLVSLLMWAAFWAVVSVALVLLFDALMGLSRKACAIRVALRRWLLGRWMRRQRSHLSVVVPFDAQ